MVALPEAHPGANGRGYMIFFFLLSVKFSHFIFLMQRLLRRPDEFLLLSRDSFQPFIEKNICSPNSF